MTFLVETGTGLVAGDGDVLSYATVVRYLGNFQDSDWRSQKAASSALSMIGVMGRGIHANRRP